MALARFLKSQLYDVHSGEPWIYASVLVSIALVVLAASAIPVVRAWRIDPAISFRQD